MSIPDDFATDNYLKVLVKALDESGRARLGTGELSRLSGVTPGSATSMIKKLKKAGYVTYESHRGCGLTASGRRYGMRMLRRHRLLETFLVESLKVDWTEVHEEAESLEHAVSEKLIDLIDAKLGHPSRDPHGEPIPAKNQIDLSVNDFPLLDLEAGQDGIIARVAGDAARLSYFRSEGLLPGARVVALRRPEESGLMGLRLDRVEKSLARSALRGVFMEGARPASTERG